MRALWLSVLLVALGLCGCSSSSSAQGQIVLHWAVAREDTGIENELCRRFEQTNPGVRVEQLQMPHTTDMLHNQYATYLVAEDDTVDVYAIDVIWPAEFGSAGWALPLDDMLSPAEREKFLRGPLQACTYQGHIYALPFYSDAGMLYYRKDLLEQAGLKPPRTWDELLAQARRLRTEQRSGLVFEGAQYEGLVCAYLELARGNGGDVLDKLGRLTLDSPPNVQALQFMVDLMHQGLAPEGVITYQEDDCLQAFSSGAATFMRSWPYVWGLTQRPGDKLLGKMGVVPVPHNGNHNSSATLGGWNLMLSRYSKHPREAWRFAQFMTSYEAEKARFLRAAYLPTREAVYSDAEVMRTHPEITSYLEVLRLAEPRPVTPYYSRLSHILQIQLHKALSGRMQAAAALREAQAEASLIPGFAEASR